MDAVDMLARTLRSSASRFPLGAKCHWAQSATRREVLRREVPPSEGRLRGFRVLKQGF
jgi:hypothetical protein